MNILFTGITSFIGKPLAYKLLNAGHEIYALVRPNSEKIKLLERHDNLYLITRDIKDVDIINPKALPKMDICIHLAWEGTKSSERMDEYIQQANVAASISLLKKAKELGVKKFIFSGSQAEYGQILDKHIEEKYSENIQENPVSMYGKAKLEVGKLASKYCENNDIEYIHLRIFSVYGKDDNKDSLVSTCIRAIKENKKVELSSCTQLWNYIYIRDIVRIIFDLVALSAYKIKNEAYYSINKFSNIEVYKKNILNIAGEDTKILKEFVLEIEDIYRKKDIFSFTKKIESKEGIPYLNPDISKLKFLLGFKENYSFREGILDIEKIYRDSE